MSLRRSAPLLALVAAVALGCNPDPTQGRPPEAGAAGVPAYASEYVAVGPGTGYPLSASWREGCPVHHTDLRGLRFTHWGFDGARHTGALVVHRSVIEQVDRAMRSLYDRRFQMERVEPVDAYGGDDGRSMAANNTSAFNCRRVAGSSSWSEHAYGKAIDVNPVQNPYVRGDHVEPEAGRSYLNRDHHVPGMAFEGGAAVQAFDAIGWGWGGRWQSAKDHQHFSQTGR